MITAAAAVLGAGAAVASSIHTRNQAKKQARQQRQALDRQRRLEAEKLKKVQRDADALKRRNAAALRSRTARQNRGKFQSLGLLNEFLPYKPAIGSSA